ncbi:FAD-binding protein [Chloroflexota bacterium]
MRELRKISGDVLIIGTGAAGCAAAITAAEKTAKVVLVNKGAFGRSGTTCLGSVVYCAGLGHSDGRDSPEQHFMDTIVEGRYISNQGLVKIMAEEAPRTVYDLERYGVAWYKQGKNHINPASYDYYQLPSPGHTFKRGVHHNEKTGQVIQNALCKEVLKHPHGIQVADDIYVWTLVVSDNRVRGALGLDLRTGELVVFSCKSLIMAAGGAGSSYKVTDMDTGATGDGFSIALNAGVELMDMEFTQFFPTAFVHPESLNGIIVATSALWTEGLKLYNVDNDRFMLRDFPEKAENLPRDILSRAIFMEISRGKGTSHGGVWLDTSEVRNWEEVRKDRPRSYIWPERFGVSNRRFEIAPTYHFTVGGLKINEKCATNITGLYAAGEVAGGVQGANRLAGNALAECMVFGQIAGNEAANFRKEALIEVNKSDVRDEEEKLRLLFDPEMTKGKTSSRTLIRRLRETMYTNVGVVRDKEGLDKAQTDIIDIKEQTENDLKIVPGKIFNYDQIHAFELFNMLELCDVVVKSASKREESRGSHYRSDHPETNNKDWLKNTIVRLKNGKAEFRYKAVETNYVPPPER